MNIQQRLSNNDAKSWAMEIKIVHCLYLLHWIVQFRWTVRSGDTLPFILGRFVIMGRHYRQAEKFSDQRLLIELWSHHFQQQEDQWCMPTLIEYILWQPSVSSGIEFRGQTYCLVCRHVNHLFTEWKIKFISAANIKRKTNIRTICKFLIFAGFRSMNIRCCPGLDNTAAHQLRNTVLVKSVNFLSQNAVVSYFFI